MSSAALFALRAAIATNTLTSDQQGPLLQALDLIAPVFPSPDELSTVGSIDERLAREWIAALYSINAGGGIMPPPPEGITNVLGTPPIDVSVDGGGVATVSITPATEADAGSMSAADKTKLDNLTPLNAWPYDAPIPASALAPELAQAQAPPGAPAQAITLRAQDAGTGSGKDGGYFNIILGAKDGAGVTGSRWWTLGCALAAGPSNPGAFTNYWNGCTFEMKPSQGVNIFTLGRGTNGSGAGIAGNEFASYGPLTIATEAAAGGGLDASISILPTYNGTGTHPDFKFGDDAGDGTGYLAFLNDVSNAASHGRLRFQWGTDVAILSQRDAGDSTDLDLVSRNGSELYFGNYFEDNRYHAQGTVLFELSRNNPGDQGWQFGSVFRITFTNTKAVRHGLDSDGKDGTIDEFNSIDTTAAAPTTIAQLVLIDNAVTQLEVTIVGREPVGGDFASFTMVSTFSKVAGVVTASTAPAVPVDTGHSVAAVGVAPAFVVSGGNVQVQATPWTAADTHWLTNAKHTVNTGTF